MELMKLLETRRTYRRFDQSKKIEKSILDDMKKSLRLASSAANLQPLRYLFITDEKLVSEVFPCTKWAARLPKEIGEPKEGEKPVLFVVVMYDEKDKSKWVDTDAGLAMSNLTLTAWNYGIGSCIIDNVNREEFYKVCDIPKNMVIQSVIGFGYPTHKSSVVDMDESGEVAYFVDEKRDYFVPKRDIEDIVQEK